jgi:hypothetical protein
MDAVVTLSDTLGREVAEAQVTHDSAHVLDMRALSKGTYLALIWYSNSIESVTLLKQ